MIINKFDGDYAFLSNFYLCPVTFEGQDYTSSEAAFQAAKTLDIYERAVFQLAKPSVAKKYGREVTLRPDWEKIKDGVMLAVLRDKFGRHDELTHKLLETGTAHLIEGNTWHDQYWGNCTCGRPSCRDDGNNMLGRVLMRVRYELEAKML